MGSAKSFLLAGAITLVSLPAANAADLPPIMPVKAPAVYDTSGWYLRGDIGMTNQQVKEIDSIAYHPPYNGAFDFPQKPAFDSGWLFGIGVGYQFNSWLRADVTGEYRGKTAFHALQRYDTLPLTGAWVGTDEYTAQKSEWLAMANLYVDLGTWWCVTPFIGAGVGAANVTIHDFRDVNSVTNAVAMGATTSKWNLAWAIHAGLAYQVTPGLAVEFAYRYLDLGDGLAGDLVGYNGANTRNDPTTFKNITSHDLKFGVRWMLGAPEPAYSPLMRKG